MSGPVRGTGQERDPDPTKMANQPALRSSSGTVWIVVGLCFAVASMVPLAAFILVSPGDWTPIAWTTAIVVIALYAALLVVRLRVASGPRRLRLMAVCFLAMAAVALIGVLVCAMLAS